MNSLSSSTPAVADIVLIGGGHAHIHVLKMMGMPRYKSLLQENGIRVTLIVPHTHTPYSGMLPGHIAGHYSYEDIHLDVHQLSRFAGARCLQAAVHRIDCSGGGGGWIHCSNDDYPPIRFDVASINIGSAPATTPHVAAPTVIPVKPIAQLCQAIDKIQERWLADTKHPYQLAIVGAGAGGIELALTLQYRLLQLRQDRDLQIQIVTQSSTIMNSHNRHVQSIFQTILQQRQITVSYNAKVIAVEEIAGNKKKRIVVDQSDTHVECDEVLWCVHAGAPSWLSTSTPLVTTVEGFVRVNDTYECIHHAGIFAAGDCCHMDQYPRPKAGVFAVRAGPILVENLVRSVLQQQPLIHHAPQRYFLGLVSTGDKYAVASKGWWFWMQGQWLWTVKDYIDRTWMAKYKDLPDAESMMQDMPPPKPPQNQLLLRRKGADVQEAFEADPMRCGGCGAKVGSTTVSRVLKAVYERQVARAKRLHLATPAPIDHDDAAMSPVQGPGTLIQTIDYFREMIADPFVFGKIVAVHALSDVHAMGAAAQSAMVLAVAPFAADEAITESTLLHLISGISDVLQDEGVRLVGGHTCEGAELACGLSVQGFADPSQRILRKRGGKIGDKIVLTKALGTGALFAADMRWKANGQYVAEAIESMTRSNVHAGRVATEFDDVHACTDVTGFGLIGHLLEMLMTNEADKSMDSIGAVLDIRSIPFLRGGLQASHMGIFSSLQPQNARNRRAVVNHSDAATSFPLEYPLLFDPQTAGGLLFFVDSEDCDEFLLLLKTENVSASIIGEVVEYPEPGQPVVAGGICTIGSGETATGQRIRIKL